MNTEISGIDLTRLREEENRAPSGSYMKGGFSPNSRFRLTESSTTCTEIIWRIHRNEMETGSPEDSTEELRCLHGGGGRSMEKGLKRYSIPVSVYMTQSAGIFAAEGRGRRKEEVGGVGSSPGLRSKKEYRNTLHGIYQSSNVSTNYRVWVISRANTMQGAVGPAV